MTKERLIKKYANRRLYDASISKHVTLEDIRGDLQMHTDASDGTASLDTMARAAQELGYQYIAITDHGPRMSMNGLNAAQLRAQWRAIDQLNQSLEGFRVLKAVEMDIRESGALSDETAASLDKALEKFVDGFSVEEETGLV